MKMLFLSLVLGFAVQAQAAEFSGHWHGNGLYDREMLDQAIETQVSMEVKLTSTELRIKECWTYQNGPLPGRTDCITSQYEVRNEDEIWARGRKIGNIYPDQVLILDSGAQVSEQMSFRFLKDDAMRFEYHYVNLDGRSEHRKATLTHLP